jgi:4-hydroxy-4-methyl-2-oxoglutarate aldolase
MTQVPPVAAIADVLALWGLDGWLTPPLQPVVPADASAMGMARTVRVAYADSGPGFAALYDLLSSDLTGQVVVVADAHTVPGAVWGEILSQAAAGSGAVAALVDGSVRDRAEMAAVGMPVYGAASAVVGPAGRAHVVAVDGEVMVGGVTIAAGDTVVIDSAGCVRVRAAEAAAVVAAARQYAAGEERVVTALVAGEPLSSAYLHKAQVVQAIRR